MSFFKNLFGVKEQKPRNIPIVKKEPMREEPKTIPPPKVKEISVDDLKKKIDNKEDFVLIDIRTEPELQFGKIKHKQLFIPMNELPSKLDELDKNKDTILYCRVGNRTYGTAQYLMQQGFKNVSSLAGGVIAWKKFDDTIISY